MRDLIHRSQGRRAVCGVTRGSPGHALELLAMLVSVVIGPRGGLRGHRRHAWRGRVRRGNKGGRGGGPHSLGCSSHAAARAPRVEWVTQEHSAAFRATHSAPPSRSCPRRATEASTEAIKKRPRPTRTRNPPAQNDQSHTWPCVSSPVTHSLPPPLSPCPSELHAGSRRILRPASVWLPRSCPLPRQLRPLGCAARLPLSRCTRMWRVCGPLLAAPRPISLRHLMVNPP